MFVVKPDNVTRAHPVLRGSGPCTPKKMLSRYCSPQAYRQATSGVRLVHLAAKKCHGNSEVVQPQILPSPAESSYAQT